MSFRVDAEDAKYIAREFYPVFSEDDFVNLPNYHIYLKLMIDGVTSKAFSAVTLAPVESKKSCRNEIIQESRKMYGRIKAKIEKQFSCGGNSVERNDSIQESLFS